MSGPCNNADLCWCSDSYEETGGCPTDTYTRCPDSTSQGGGDGLTAADEEGAMAAEEAAFAAEQAAKDAAEDDYGTPSDAEISAVTSLATAITPAPSSDEIASAIARNSGDAQAALKDLTANAVVADSANVSPMGPVNAQDAVEASTAPDGTPASPEACRRGA